MKPRSRPTARAASPASTAAAASATGSGVTDRSASAARAAIATSDRATSPLLEIVARESGQRAQLEDAIRDAPGLAQQALVDRDTRGGRREVLERRADADVDVDSRSSVHFAFRHCERLAREPERLLWRPLGVIAAARRASTRARRRRSSSPCGPRARRAPRVAHRPARCGFRRARILRLGRAPRAPEAPRRPTPGDSAPPRGTPRARAPSCPPRWPPSPARAPPLRARARRSGIHRTSRARASARPSPPRRPAASSRGRQRDMPCVLPRRHPRAGAP